MPIQCCSKFCGKKNNLKLNVLTSFVSISFCYFFIQKQNKCYSKVGDKDEMFFSQSTKLDQSKTKTLPLYNEKCLCIIYLKNQLFIHPFAIQVGSQLSRITLSETPL